jgi:hypothetical protein
MVPGVGQAKIDARSNKAPGDIDTRQQVSAGLHGGE